MTDWIQNAFMIRALVAGVLVGALASYYGAFIVQRRLSFLGSGLAHAAFGGIALALLLKQDPLLIAIPFTIIVAIAINWVRSETILAADTAIGIFFAVAVALGVIFLSIREGTTYDAFSYLFGSILAISMTDLWIIILIFAIGLLTLPRLWGNWAFATFDEESARVDNHSVGRDDYALYVLLAVTIVAAIKMVGILLIAAFLVIPAAAARLLSPTFFWMTVVSVCLGILSAFTGLIGSYELDLPSGATIVLCQAIFFGLALLVSRWRAGPL
ncbi:MAG: metal ABC transporter permease [Bacteroidetes bacterium]|nr:metal ABC transporter permease [Bacteroidota bacterium]